MAAVETKPLRELQPKDLNKDVVTAKADSKKREKLSSLCKTPPSLIKNKHGQDYHRGLFLGEV